MTDLGGSSSNIGFKGQIRNNRYVLNRGVVNFGGIGSLTGGAIYFVTSGDLEQEITTVVTPDKVAVSGGQVEPFEWELGVPMHHAENQQLFMWYGLCHGIQYSYKTNAFVSYFRSGSQSAPEGIWPTNPNRPETYGLQFELFGIFPKKFVLPATDKGGEGETAIITWTFMVDAVWPGANNTASTAFESTPE